MIENPDPEGSKKAIEAIKQQEYKTTPVPQHDMMKLFTIFMKVDKMQALQEFDIAIVNSMVQTAIPMARASQCEVLEFSRGHCVMKMPFEPNKNHVGTMYAGALFTLAELPGGAVLISAFDMQ